VTRDMLDLQFFHLRLK